jgi:hypothetical protein
MPSSVFELADELRVLKEQKKSLEAELKEINRNISEREAELAQHMITEELSSFQRGGRTFYLSTKTFISAAAGKKPRLVAWLKQSPHKELVREDIHAQTLSAWARELLEEDQLPAEIRDCLNIYEKQTIGIRKAQ